MRTISWQEFKPSILWEDDRYDWPLCGVGMVDGRRVYFKCIDDDGTNRKFGLYDVPDWQWIDERHECFCRHVGEHCNYVDGKRGPHILRPKAEWNKFYDKYRDKPLVMNPDWMIAIVDSSLDQEARF